MASTSFLLPTFNTMHSRDFFRHQVSEGPTPPPQTTASTGGRGFGKILNEKEEDKKQISGEKTRSEKKKEYQEQLRRAKRSPSLVKLLSSGSGSSKKDEGGIKQGKMAPRGF